MNRRDIQSFGKLLRLLGSDNHGERATAALKATEFLKGRGYDWHTVVAVLEKTVESDEERLRRAVQEANEAATAEYRARKPPPGSSIDHREAANACLSLFNYWNEREENFLFDMVRLDWPTQRQMDWLRRLYERYRREVGS